MWENRVRIQSLEEITIGLPIAEMGTRGLAQLVDFILLLFACSVVIVLGVVAGSFLKIGQVFLWIMIATGVFLIQSGYFLFFELIGDGQTPGKRLIGLRVVDAQGGRLTFPACCIRNLLRWVDFLPIFYGVGVVAMIVSPKNQRLGDLAAGTVVIGEERKAAGESPAFRTYPPGLEAAEIALIETILLRTWRLAPERRTVILGLFYDYLSRRHPEILLGKEIPPADEDKLVLLYTLFPPQAG